MDSIKWSDDFSVGIEAIDTQHRAKIEIINDLIKLPSTPASSPEETHILLRLLSYSHQHLSYEEDLLIDNDYPEFEEHLDSHSYYRGYVTRLLDKTINEETRELVTLFLRDWWMTHILHEDMKYKPFLEEKDIC
jgi:hemerythrin